MAIIETIKAVGKTGRSDINLPPFDPLTVRAINIAQGENSPVAVNLSFRNLSFHGIPDAKVTKIL